MSRTNAPGSNAPVGRIRELDAMRLAYQASAQGTSATIFVGGEPGIGKSYLLQCFAGIVSDQQGTVVQGNCYEDITATPYGPFVEILRSLNAHTGAVGNENLGWIVPEWSTGAPDVAVPSGGATDAADRMRLFDAVTRYIARIAVDQPVVLIIDDLQWADEPTALLLRYVARSLRGARVTIVGAYRDTDLDPTLPFEGVLRDLQREHLARRVSLRRLVSEDTRALMAGFLDVPADRVSADAVARVHDASEGVPFFIEELVLHLREEGRLSVRRDSVWDLQPGVETFVPPGVRSVVGHRLSRLSAQGRDALMVASVIGKDFTYDLLQRVLYDRDPEIAEYLDLSIDEAVRRRLIVEQHGRAGQSTSFAFAHEQIREVLYWGINAIRRRGLHEAIGRELERSRNGSQNTTARIAHHFSNGEDLAKAAHFSRLAGDDAARSHAYEEALRHYDAVLDILDLSKSVEIDERVRFETLLTRDIVLARGGDPTPREHSIHQLLQSASESSIAERQFKATVRAVRYAIAVGDLDAAVRYATEAHRHACSLSEAEQLSASWLLGQAHAGRPEGEPSHLDRPVESLTAAASHLSDARALAERLGDRLAAAWLTQEIGVVLWALSAENDVEGRSRARTFLVEALEGFRAVGARKGEVTALIALAYRRPVSATPASGSVQGSYVAFLEEIRRLRKTEHLLARESERPKLEALSLLSIHLFCRTEGWYEIALDRALQALSWAEAAHEPRITVLARLGLSETESLLGRGARALQYAEQAAATLVAQAATGSASSQRGALLVSLARAQLLLGNNDIAVDLAQQRLALAESSGRTASIAESEVQLAEILETVGGRHADAVKHAGAALERSTQLPGSITWDVRANLVLARAALDAGDGPGALSMSTAAVSRMQARDIKRVWLLCRGAVTHALALESVADADGAREWAKTALEHVERAAGRIEEAGLRETFQGTAPWVVEVREVAARFGILQDIVASPLRPLAPGGLTPREVQVVSLVAAGKTNREIADDLYISEKTVARHLTNIYIKIDSQSRTQAAAWAFRQGIA